MKKGFMKKALSFMALFGVIVSNSSISVKAETKKHNVYVYVKADKIEADEIIPKDGIKINKNGYYTLGKLEMEISDFTSDSDKQNESFADTYGIYYGSAKNSEDAGWKRFDSKIDQIETIFTNKAVVAYDKDNGWAKLALPYYEKAGAMKTLNYRSLHTARGATDYTANVPTKEIHMDIGVPFVGEGEGEPKTADLSVFQLIYHRNPPITGETDKKVADATGLIPQKENKFDVRDITDSNLNWKFDTYVFTGWTENKDGTGKTFQPKDIITLTSSVKDATGDDIKHIKNLYAKWEPKVVSEASVTKVWVNDKAEERPDSIKVTLTNNVDVTKTETITLNNTDNYKGKFTKYPKV